MTTSVTIAVAVAVLALPSAVLAFSTSFDAGMTPATAPRTIGTLRDDAAAPRLARGFSLQLFSRAEVYPFTPAKNPNRPDRSVTVAVRLDPQALSPQGRLADAGGATAQPALRLAQTAFNLGVARGYRNFSQDLVPPGGTRKPDQPDLVHDAAAPAGGIGEPSRFSPRIVIDDKPAAGRAPRSFAGDRDDQVDLGGSYRVGRNLNVTAGVRYSQDRERLKPLTDGNQDNQAVYLGTQLRF